MAVKRLKQEEWTFVVVETELEDPDHWNALNLEDWLAEVLVRYYLENREGLGKKLSPESKEKSQST